MLKTIKRVNVLLFIFLYALFFIFTLSNDKKFKIYRVGSDSMKGVLNVGDFVIINHEVSIYDFEEEDIVVFLRESDGKLIIHYVEGVGNGSLSTKYISYEKGKKVYISEGETVFKNNLTGKHIFKISPLQLILYVVVSVMVSVSVKKREKLNQEFENIKIDFFIKEKEL